MSQSVDKNIDSSQKDWGSFARNIGIIFLVISIFGLGLGVSNGDSRYVLSWLIGGSFWLAILLGMLMWTMLGYIFEAGWSIILRRQFEHAISGFKWLALIFLPILLVSLLFSESSVVPWQWMDTANSAGHGMTVGQDPLYTAKAGYLNKTFFAFRFVLYFVIWVCIAESLRRKSFQMDKDADLRHHDSAYRLSTVGVILVPLALTFAAIDWYKSMEYHWFSTMYGVWFFAASLRTSLAATLILSYILASKGWLKGIFTRAHSHLLSCLLLAFTVFWAYISFSQYFIQYNANIPEEVYWYNIRLFDSLGDIAEKSSGWYVAMGLIFGYFFFPFIYLLFYKNKFNARILFISTWILGFHLLDLYWNILPQKIYDDHGHVTVRQLELLPVFWDLAMIVGVGGILIWSFIRSGKKEKAIPIHDPRILESLNLHE